MHVELVEPALQDMTAEIRGRRNPHLSANDTSAGLQGRMRIVKGLKRLLAMEQVQPSFLRQP